MRLGPYSLDENTGEVRWDDFRCRLTPIEQRVVEALVEHFPKPLSAEGIMEAADILSSESARMHVLHIRRKLNDDTVIEGLRQRGYRINPEYVLRDGECRR